MFVAIFAIGACSTGTLPFLVLAYLEYVLWLPPTIPAVDILTACCASGLELDRAFVALEMAVGLAVVLVLAAITARDLWRYGWRGTWNVASTRALADVHAAAQRTVADGEWWATLYHRIGRLRW